VLSYFDTAHERDGQTDERTDRQNCACKQGAARQKHVRRPRPGDEISKSLVRIVDARTDRDLVNTWRTTLMMLQRTKFLKVVCKFSLQMLFLVSETTIHTVTNFKNAIYQHFTLDLSSSRVKDTLDHTPTPAFSVDCELLRYFPDHSFIHSFIFV